MFGKLQFIFPQRIINRKVIIEMIDADITNECFSQLNSTFVLLFVIHLNHLSFFYFRLQFQ